MTARTPSGDQTLAGAAPERLTGNGKAGRFSLLHPDPVILYAVDAEIRDSDSALWSVLEVLEDRTPHLIVSPSWTVVSRGSRERLVAEIRQVSDRVPHVVPMAICPTAAEADLLRREQVVALHCSEAALIREDLFSPTPGRRAVFDAIYDARWADYKRHDLAGEVRSLALIAQPPWHPEEGCTVEYFRRAHAAVSHATWISVPWGSTNPRWISYTQINAAYNQARVGLCLSQEEGYMAASIQYLLAGLPVVTTPSRGGRDEFFDPAHVRWVEPEPQAVARAVEELVSLDLDPATIRRATLERVQEHRGRLWTWIRNTIRAEGGDFGRWSATWPTGLPNKLCEPSMRASEIVAEIDRERPPA